MQCDGNGNANANVDDRGDYNSSPCTSYRRAKNDIHRRESNARPDRRFDPHRLKRFIMKHMYLLWSFALSTASRVSGIRLFSVLVNRRRISLHTLSLHISSLIRALANRMYLLQSLGLTNVLCDERRLGSVCATSHSDKSIR